MFAKNMFAIKNVRFSISIKRSFMNASLLGYLGYQILNADESINHGFKTTGLALFQSEPTIETVLSREEQILNLCERFDKFACSDSENDE